MENSEQEHEKIASRISQILLKLNNGETFTRQELMEEFKISDRTYYRDINRLDGFIEKSPDGRYQLAPEYRGTFNLKDLESFAKLTGVNQLFPGMSHRFLVALVNTLSQNSFLIKGHHYEQSKPNDSSIIQLEDAIKNHRVCQLKYKNKDRILEPYRLVNSNGIWYLAATENQQLKAFTLSRISLLWVTDDTFNPIPDVLKDINESDDIWYSQEKTEVLISVAPQVAYYFSRRPIFPRQELIKELENGGLIISSQISHPNQILPLVRYWIPKVNVLEPAWLKEMLESELRQFLKT